MIKITICLALGLMTLFVQNLAAATMNKHYPSNREPLIPSRLVPLPLGTIKPEGWLRDQLVVQANGLTGHLDEFWPALAANPWKGGEGWERPPYYLDGLVPLAYLLDDERLIAKATSWTGWIVNSSRGNGWFGPAQNNDRWPLAIALKVLTQYHEATGDPRAITVMQNYFRFLKDNPPDWPDNAWRGVRAMEHVVTAFWLHRRTGDPDLLTVANSIFENSFDWVGYFTDFPYPEEVLAKGIQYGHPSHVVNIAMAIKHPGVYYQLSKEPRHRDAVYQGLKNLDRHHGQVTGRFSGDEHLAGRRPTQGTELCAVVEFMFSLENLIAVLGDVALADRLELLAYNANPGTCTADYWTHQYDQQANQVLVSVAKRQWSTNSDYSNLYGLEPNYGCCTANMHQGWPKFVTHMWMATPDQGLAAVAYGPNRVTAKVGEAGDEVTIVQETDYPFAGEIRLTVRTAQPAAFPLHLRIPHWADGAKLVVAGQEMPTKAGEFAIVNRTWKTGDVVELMLPMNLRTERRYNDAVSILRGPLYFSLRIGEKWTKLKSYHDTLPVADWQIESTTPWNFGLQIDPANPDASIQATTRKPGKVPFDTDAAPVVLKVRGKPIPGWQLEHHSAGETPVSPIATDAPVTDLELIPYGSTRLRITEFPVVR